MATVNFLVKGNNNPSSIYLRFKHGRKHDYTKSTGKIIDPKNWSEIKRAPLTKRDETLKVLDGDLKRLSKDIVIAFNGSNNNEIDGEWIQKQIDIFNKVFIPESDKSSDLVLEAIKTIIKYSNTRPNSKGGLGLSKSRINSYSNLLNVFKKFEGKRKIKVKEVNLKFAKDFLNYLINDCNYSEGYAKKKIDDLKTVCLEAEINGIETSAQLKKVYGGKTKNKHIIYLNRNELEMIKKLDLKYSDLDNIRKWLLLGCNIGQRGGDLLKLTKSNFVTRRGLEIIELKQQKTGSNVSIPILDTTREILKEGLPEPINIQKFNSKLKDLCELAGIKHQIEGSKIVVIDEQGEIIEKDKNGKYLKKGRTRRVTGVFPKHELITSHVCRRSFATNLYGTLPTPLIMQITAHGTEKMFLQYIGKSSYDYAQQIADFYSKQDNTQL